MLLGPRALIVSGAVLALVAAPRPLAAQQSPAPAPAATSPSVVAEVNGEPITAADLDKAVGQQISRLEDQIYNLRKQQLDTLIAERLLNAEAAKRRVSISALLDAEVNAKVTVVTEAEIDAFVETNKAKLNGQPTQVRENVRTQLQRQKAATQLQAFVVALRAANTVSVHLPPPSVYRAAVEATGAAAIRGPADAPITIMEFTDFHCPFCKSSQATIAAVLAKYDGKIRLVQHDLPIDQLHPDARKVHEAALRR